MPSAEKPTEKPVSRKRDKIDFFSSLRQEAFSRLDEQDQIYLDYTGAGLYPQSSLRMHFDMLETSLLGNPHSSNPTSKLATNMVEQTRAEVLSFFNADPFVYDVVFTPNASGAIKLVAECYPFRRGSSYAILVDNHNSVNGIREFARKSGASVAYLPLDNELRATHDITTRLRRHSTRRADSLFAYPAQSNFTGVKHPLHLVDAAQKMGYDVLLDAAAFVPTSRLDLSKVRPDFVCMSFYKMFGFPTGIGALVARKAALRKLRKPWFAGGTVQFASVVMDAHLLEQGPARFEDGTINFLGIPAISTGLQFLREVGMDRVTRHVLNRTEEMLSGLLSLRHTNGRAMVTLYGPKTTNMRGGTVTFNLKDSFGAKVDPAAVEAAANRKKISLRTGCFCNPGAAESAYRLDETTAKKCMMKMRATGEAFTQESFSKCIGEEFSGSVRVSVGIATNTRDIDRFLGFLQEFCGGESDSSEEVPVRKEKFGRIGHKHAGKNGSNYKWADRDRDEDAPYGHQKGQEDRDGFDVRQGVGNKWGDGRRAASWFGLKPNRWMS